MYRLRSSLAALLETESGDYGILILRIGIGAALFPHAIHELAFLLEYGVMVEEGEVRPSCARFMSVSVAALEIVSVLSVLTGLACRVTASALLLLLLYHLSIEGLPFVAVGMQPIGGSKTWILLISSLLCLVLKGSGAGALDNIILRRSFR